MKRMSMFITLAMVASLVGLVASPASAATIHWVNDDAAVGGNTSCADPGYDTITAAIAVSASTDTIRVCAGTYNETVSLPAGFSAYTLTGDDASDRPLITGGMTFGAGMVDLTLRDIIVTGGTSWVVSGGSATGLTMDHVKVDGDNVAGRHGVASTQIHGAVDVHDSEFVNIPNWAVFDTRSGSGGATAGALLTTFNFSDNYLANNGGHVNARGTIGFETASVTISGNTVEDYPDAPANNSAAVFKVFYADQTTFADNDISNIGILQANIGGFPYGAGLMPRNAGPLTITGNMFDDSVQGVAFEPRNATSGGFADGVIEGGTVSGNDFGDNSQGIFVTTTNHPTSTIGALDIAQNNFVGNAEAIDNDSASIMDAECNWWGAANGPGPVGPGSGDNVSNNVDFRPWLTAPAPGGACNGGQPVPTSKADCKEDGWMTRGDDNGRPFANQGDCQSYFATGGKNKAAG